MANEIERWLQSFAEAFNTPARDLARCIRELSVLIRMLSDEEAGYLGYAGFLLLWRLRLPEQYRQFNDAEITADEVGKHMIRLACEVRVEIDEDELVLLLYRAFKTRDEARELATSYRAKYESVAAESTPQGMFDSDRTKRKHKAESLFDTASRLERFDPHKTYREALQLVGDYRS